MRSMSGPDGFPTLDVVLIHVTGLKVKPGDRVEGGVTVIGAIRKLSDKFHDQLADYLKPGKSKGDHVHIQINNANDPKYKGLQGSIEPTS